MMSSALFKAMTVNGIRKDYHLLPDFLIPCFASNPSSTILYYLRPFSTSPHAYHRKTINRNRGVSPLRRTGLRQPLSVSKEPLPVPVPEAERSAKIEVDESHGLWGFFNAKRSPLNTPVEDHAFGRSWGVEELRYKSWNDLHRLWWICCKEQNRIATSNAERRRLKAAYGDFEAKERSTAVTKTQVAIKQVLIQRMYGWEDARKIIEFDPRFTWPDGQIQFKPYADDVVEEDSSGDTPEGEHSGHVKL